jgi:serine/threonine protein kinase
MSNNIHFRIAVINTMQSNILIDEYGTASLCDFGLSKIRTHATTVLELPNLSEIRGTLRWMAPEQMKHGIVNKTTDIYSFGMTIYEVGPHSSPEIFFSQYFKIFSGIPPFAHTVDGLLFKLIVDQELRPPRPADPLIVKIGLDNSMWSLIEQCWAKQPDNRPGASEIAILLESLGRQHHKIAASENFISPVCTFLDTQRAQFP